MKEELTIEKARNLSYEYLNKIEDKKLKEFLLIHSLKSSELAVLIGKIKKANIEVLKIAGFVHDIGYSIDEKGHPQHSLSILEKQNFEINEKLKDCILNHGSNDKPNTKEGEIFQMADKLSIIDKETLALFLKSDNMSNEEKGFLEMMLSKSLKFIDRL